MEGVYKADARYSDKAATLFNLDLGAPEVRGRTFAGRHAGACWGAVWAWGLAARGWSLQGYGRHPVQPGPGGARGAGPASLACGCALDPCAPSPCFPRPAAAAAGRAARGEVGVCAAAARPAAGHAEEGGRGAPGGGAWALVRGVQGGCGVLLAATQCPGPKPTESKRELHPPACWPQVSMFGAAMDLKSAGLADLPRDILVPGVAVFSRRATPLAAWTNGLEIAGAHPGGRRASSPPRAIDTTRLLRRRLRASNGRPFAHPSHATPRARCAPSLEPPKPPPLCSRQGGRGPLLPRAGDGRQPALALRRVAGEPRQH